MNQCVGNTPPTGLAPINPTLYQLYTSNPTAFAMMAENVGATAYVPPTTVKFPPVPVRNPAVEVWTVVPFGPSSEHESSRTVVVRIDRFTIINAYRASERRGIELRNAVSAAQITAPSDWAPQLVELNSGFRNVRNCPRSKGIGGIVTALINANERTQQCSLYRLKRERWLSG